MKKKSIKKKNTRFPQTIKTDKSIAEIVKEYLDSDGTIVSCRGTFHGHDFNDLLSIVNGTADNYLIFDNAGGRVFHIWMFGKQVRGGLKGFVDFIKENSTYNYMCKIKGEERVFRMFPKHHQGNKSW